MRKLPNVSPDLLRTARHESAHAIYCHYHNIEYEFATIRPDGSGQVVGIAAPKSIPEIKHIIVMDLVGAVAGNGVERHRPMLQYARGAEDDTRDAGNLIELLLSLGEFGTKEAWAGRRLKPIHWFDRKARQFVNAHEQEIDRVARELYRKVKLSAAQVAVLLGGAP
jgi:hypothetical protein